ncbi:hypothetical protein KOR42_11030 [Thalassoglobus neptunius]|uniref:Prenyltransferase and squalene oxidase repeat protein n=1 Tax=Thalassoglobus neptunius TaxID=1938619 RepID=A0A5C5X3P9_9PLAN|nr:HEAT repeat domain-containing protein [Thalassoglobus neptunius]TWT57737.1 hypothetical protein KOR42_11030 [Thalassoglobus neptunius]
MKSIVSLIVIGLFSSNLLAADPAAVKKAIAQGSGYLQGIFDKTTGGKRTVTALALYKAGASPDSGAVGSTVNEILERFEGGKYRPASEHIYEAGVEATLLADISTEKYKPQLKMIADYIIGQQKENGGWDYPTGRSEAKYNGDTSVIQYACLALWAAERAGIEIDDKVWEKVLSWHVRFKNKDSGFAYCPGTTTGHFKDASTLNMTAAAVANMHIAMLHIDPEFLPLKDRRPKKREEESGPTGPKFGILQQVDLDGEEARGESVRISGASVETVKNAFGWLGTRFRVENKESPHATYYYYTLERMAALADVENVGSHAWFDECANYLIGKQLENGSWNESSFFDEGLDTAFAILFLTRSTGKLLKRVSEPGFGDGLLAGGRGLPDDLSDVDFNGRTIQQKEKPTEPLDVLLASLSNTGNLDMLDVQEQIIEQVQIGNREDLIGQVDQLVKLVDHPDPQIRQTVVWALGRTGNMNLTQYLIDRLSDSDLGVMIEARNALCWISRRPTGFGFPEDPLEELPPSASEDQKSAAIAQWHKNLVLTWGEWYLKNRPFEDRGDAFEARLRKKMENLKYGFE